MRREESRNRCSLVPTYLDTLTPIVSRILPPEAFLRRSSGVCRPRRKVQTVNSGEGGREGVTAEHGAPIHTSLPLPPPALRAQR
jgi:hypothetical protein